MHEPNTIKPIMLYDGDCGFCTRWIERWKKITGERIVYEPYQEALRNFPQLTAIRCRQAVQLIESDQTISSGAHAVFRALALAGKFPVLLWMYEHIPLYRKLSEAVYQWIAHRRGFFSRLSGRQDQCPVDR